LSFAYDGILLSNSRKYHWCWQCE